MRKSIENEFQHQKRSIGNVQINSSMTHLISYSRQGEFAESDSVRIRGTCSQSHLCLEIQNVLVRKVNNRWLFGAESRLRLYESGPMCDAKMVFEDV